jgi:hypothetical protein
MLLMGISSIKRLTTPIRNTDYTYWSSPVLGFTLGGVSPRTLNGKFYSYEVAAGSEDWKQESSATIMSGRDTLSARNNKWNSAMAFRSVSLLLLMVFQIMETIRYQVFS